MKLWTGCTFFSKKIHLCVVSTLQLRSGMDRKFVHSLFMCLSKNVQLYNDIHDKKFRQGYIWKGEIPNRIFLVHEL